MPPLRVFDTIPAVVIWLKIDIPDFLDAMQTLGRTRLFSRIAYVAQLHRRQICLNSPVGPKKGGTGACFNLGCAYVTDVLYKQMRNNHLAFLHRKFTTHTKGHFMSARKLPVTRVSEKRTGVRICKCSRINRPAGATQCADKWHVTARIRSELLMAASNRHKC